MSAMPEDGAGAPGERDPWAPPPEDAVPPPKQGPWAPPVPAGPVPPPGAANPFAAPGEPVPPPPVSPEGPGQTPMPMPMPYGYGGFAGHPGQQGPPAFPGQQGPPGGGGYPGYGHPGYGHPGYGYPGQGMPGGPPGYGWPAMPMAPSNGIGVAALVLGIISAVGFCLWPLAIVLGILAMIFGVVGRGKAKRGEATNGGQALAGIICGAAGIVLGSALLVFLIVGSAGEWDDDAGAPGGPPHTAPLSANA
ncbi:DUF4190 domain-containing protein [Streptomyces sp. DSM 118878]